MDVEIAKFIAQAAIAVVGAFLAAHLATRRFRSEKWWERKAAAYSELVEALHHMKWYSSEHIDAAMENRWLAKEDKDEYWKQYKEARRNVWRIADASAFLVSPKVHEAIVTLERALGEARNADWWLEHAEQEYAAIQKCLVRVKELARHELGVKDA
ncbi:MAG: hypothetical protein R3E36_10105 [Nitrosomonas sp.]|nr:hypothetical protein [Nitrosomonas sp.]